MTEVRSPQLRMVLRSLQSLAPLRLPAGYALRRFQPDDTQSWVDLLNSTLSLGEWDLHRAAERMTGSVRVVPEGIHFVTEEGVPVATACLTHHDDMLEAEMGWVAVLPRCQGLGLGYQVCLATLRYIGERGYPGAMLYTDDHRLAAIKTYLRLGFEPWMAHESHEERWREVLATLGWQSPTGTSTPS